MYTKLVLTGVLSLEKVIELLCDNPRKRFNIPLGNDFSIWKLDEEFIVDPEDFLSLGRSTPFAGEKLFGECVLTVCDGKVVFSK